MSSLSFAYIPNSVKNLSPSILMALKGAAIQVRLTHCNFFALMLF
jgi:hypothetical protein